MGRDIVKHTIKCDVTIRKEMREGGPWGVARLGSWFVPDFELDIMCGCDLPKLPEGASDDGVRGSTRDDGGNCGPVFAEDEDCRAVEGRKPKPCGHKEVPTFQAGDGEAEVLEVVRVVELVKLQS